MKKLGIIAATILILLSSCDSYTASGAMTGGLIGSAIGGITGGHRGHDVGALVGAVVGATAGAAVRDAEIRRAEAAYYDDMYSVPAYSRNDAKAQRIARYHANTKAKYSGRGRYSTSKSSSGSSVRSRGADISGNYGGFSLEATDSNEGTTVQKDESGRTDDAKYDDRIEMK